MLAIVAGFNDYNWAEADREIAVATGLQPRDATTLNYAARIAHAEERKDESLRLINAAISVNPLDPYAHLALGQMLYATGDLDGAELPYRRSLEISPVFDGSHYYLALMQLLRGDRTAAHAEVAAEPAENARNAGLSMELFAQGRRGDSEAALSRLVVSSSDRWPFGIVQACAFRRDWEQTLKWLERSFELRDPDLTMNVRGDPLLAPLHGDPRYTALLRKMHLSP